MEARVLTEFEAGAYRLMRLRSVKELPSLASPEILRELTVFAERTAGLLSTYASQGTRVWGVFDDVSLAGVVAVTRQLAQEKPKWLSLWGLYVRPGYRGTPASRVMMEAVIAWCGRQPGEPKLCTRFPRDNVRAHQLFDRYGFVEIQEQMSRAPTTGQIQTMVIMSRGL
ncbi:GNAT family N-acetyltransferase [Luteimonas sp. SX5]|uniref:GNAT family N-acetyltransferase n=1 Tax=Luteimonas galliterrae TaxID=2940486 RepID=A0ABT0ML40_9GAMM|nr:GNAT family N-acetyltransferase [Luteimonas galliterrae]MCL1634939.1 GNAT family N-acetyltransferase [Luteimonas galliterrae]